MRRGIDAALVHRRRHAGGRDADGQIEEGQFRTGSPSAFDRLPLGSQGLGVVVPGVEPVVGGRRNRRDGAVEPSHRARAVEPQQAIGLTVVERLQRRRDVGDLRPGQPGMCRLRQHFLHGGSHLGIGRGFDWRRGCGRGALRGGAGRADGGGVPQAASTSAATIVGTSREDKATQDEGLNIV